MTENGTLKAFAEQNGINYQTAKTWFRRGRIAFDDGGFYIVRLKPGETEGVALKPGESLKPYAAVLKPETTDSAQDSRLCRREDENPESHRESCAGCSAASAD